MRLFLIFLMACLYSITVLGQELPITIKDSVIDAKYREDQFYIGATYNALIFKPDNVSQNGFSSGIHFGFIRDFPINKNRTYAIGVGLGLSFNSFNQNLSITKSVNGFDFNVIDEDKVNVIRNKFYTHLIELPIEFRWRNSSVTDYKFWRIYPGFKAGYVFSNSTKSESDLGTFNYKGIDVFEKLHYGVTLSTGYNTWNLHVYYGLNTIFTKEAKVNDSTLDLSTVKVGLLFYIF